VGENECGGRGEVLGESRRRARVRQGEAPIRDEGRDPKVKLREAEGTRGGWGEGGGCGEKRVRVRGEEYQEEGASGGK